MKTPSLKIMLMAYPDNPSGVCFFREFQKKQISLSGLLIENKKGKTNWVRLAAKLKKDGPVRTCRRLLQVAWLKITGRNLPALAERSGIPVHRVDQFNSPECASILEKESPDILAIASAPILKPFIFQKARRGTLNAHPGWLPAFRGLGANAFALEQGKRPGVTVHWIDSGIDTGKIIAREHVPVRRRDTLASINDRAVSRGAEMMADIIAKLDNGTLVENPVLEPQGPNFPAMPYSRARKINRMIRKGRFDS
ncbi:hypothetical protein JW906_12930 [bacterium]|nr:hypothetical protein [bacterium]